MRLLAIFLFACASAEGASRSSPHGLAGECRACHADAAGAGFVAGDDTTTCRGCHDEEPHQVGIEPVRVEVPPAFPLPGGKLACQTCHDEPACDGKEIADDNPRFFRGGPYARIGDLCTNCHKETAADRFDPHTAMRNPTEREDACLFCHESRPVEGATDALRLPGADTCRGCHFETSHAGSGEHLTTLDPGMAKRALLAGLPLADGTRATCATCHDPHPPGTTAAATARAGWSEQRVVPEAWERQVLEPSLRDRAGEHAGALVHGHDLLRLSLDDGQLCQACHGSGPARETPR